jgi:hypothetical protein
MAANEIWQKEVIDEVVGKVQVVKGLNPWVVASKAKTLKIHWRKLYSSFDQQHKTHVEMRRTLLCGTKSAEPLPKEFLEREKAELMGILDHTLIVDDAVSLVSLIEKNSGDRPPKCIKSVN